MNLPDGIDAGRFERLLALAQEEDWARTGDLTALLFGPEADAPGRWRLVCRLPGRVAGLRLVEPILATLAPLVRVTFTSTSDGDDAPAGAELATLAGPIGSMLGAERIMLNFLQRLCGIATLTARFVRATAGTRARIFDTRKTTPGWRDLERYAVRMGGGCNHRHGLHDAVLLKDNHLAGVPTARLAHRLFELLGGVDRLPVRPSFVEVEVDSLDQLREALKVVGINVVLLDNFSISDLKSAVALRDEAGLAKRVELEASGGITLENAASVAQTGVDRIAIGALTHSATALDVGLDAVP